MKKILVFSGSNSSRSINQKLAVYTSSMIQDYSVKVIDLREFNIPIYSEDLERDGFPEGVVELHSVIRGRDGLIISVPEHNGNLPAFFKNILDWLSRLDRPFLSGIKIFLMSTSPGSRGGQSSLQSAEEILRRFKGEIVSTFSLSFFNNNFAERMITDPGKSKELEQRISEYLGTL